MRTVSSEVMAKRISVISQLAEDIAEINDEQLPMQSKYHDMMYFVCEMLRTASGLADLEEELVYGYWK